jgi:hypothetical protein
MATYANSFTTDRRGEESLPSMQGKEKIQNKKK